MKKHADERTGEWIMGLEVILFAFFPILINFGAKSIPPLHFLAYATLISVPLFLITTILRKETKQIFNKQALPYVLGVVLFVVTLPNILIFWGTSLTSGINTTLLMQSEIIFAALICVFIGEKLTRNRILGIFLLLVGSIFILYNGTFTLNRGDLAIFLAPFFYPIGNIFAKKALTMISWSTLLLMRMSIGGAILILLAGFIEIPPILNTTDWLILIIIGFVILGISKIFWYMALGKLDITKTTAIAMSYPAISIFLAYILFNEIPTYYQWTGIITIGLGLSFIIKTNSKQYSDIL